MNIDNAMGIDGGAAVVLWLIFSAALIVYAINERLQQWRRDRRIK